MASRTPQRSERPGEPGAVPSSLDAIIATYKAGLDRSLIRRSLERTVEERLEALMQVQEFAAELRRAGRAAGGG
jgi:hypothetical protein